MSSTSDLAPSGVVAAQRMVQINQVDGIQLLENLVDELHHDVVELVIVTNEGNDARVKHDLRVGGAQLPKVVGAMHQTRADKIEIGHAAE